METQLSLNINYCEGTLIGQRATPEEKIAKGVSVDGLHAMLWSDYTKYHHPSETLTEKELRLRTRAVRNFEQLLLRYAARKVGKFYFPLWVKLETRDLIVLHGRRIVSVW